MWRQTDPLLDAASAISLGKRDYQEDAVVSDCPMGGDTGLVVLSDGMGGHASGDVASKIVMTEVFSELKLHSGNTDAATNGHVELLTRAAHGADECISAYVEDNPETFGMGATLIAGILTGASFHWVSVGDSPLYLFRAGDLIRLNEEHSYGAQIDAMVAEGRMEADDARDHPDRTCLTSVVGGNGIARIDCPPNALKMLDGDVLVFASDGIEYLETDRIRSILCDWHLASSAQIAAQFLREIEMLDDPEQDNLSIAVVKVRFPAVRAKRTAPAPRTDGAPVSPVRPAALRRTHGMGARDAFEQLDRRHSELDPN